MTVFALIIIGLATPLYAMPFWHGLQTLSYHTDEYARYEGRNVLATWVSALWMHITAILVAVIASLANGMGLQYVSLTISAAWVALGIYRGISFLKKDMKKPLVFTKRIWRLAVSTLLVSLALVFLLFLPAYVTDRQTAFWPVCIAVLLLDAGMPWVVLLAGILAQPVEKAVQLVYIRDAKKKLNRVDGLIRIGITGSYGKTSSKVILGTILSSKFRTFITPASYNTPMGVTRAIRENMSEDTEIFVAEIGARHLGDVKDICKIVRPDIGLITSVGPQHLETFGSLQNVVKGKYELIENLSEGGLAVFPGDVPLCRDMYAKTRDPKVLFGMHPDESTPYSVWAEDMHCTNHGVEFTLADDRGTRVPCSCKLLGKHNISNILGCAAVARHLGMTLEEISRGISQLRPVEHRLQLLETNGAVTVIDDAFNASPAGTRAALEVLQEFPGRKIVITPGIVELGERQDAENKAFGEAMADVADIAILVAGNADAIAEGLRSKGFRQEYCYTVANLKEAMAIQTRLVQPGDVVLFENDLPDTFEK